MPKIIIKEVDDTTAGTTEYSNFTVLVPGLAAEHKNVAAGSIYQLSSQDTFEKNIGLVDSEESYGNKVAYELLGLGYTIIYKVITDVAEIAATGFFDEFKDKALYDIRYIVPAVINNTEVAGNAIALAHFDNTISDPFKTGRGDCVALLDLDIDGIDVTTTAELEKQVAAKNSTYAAYFAPKFCLKNYMNSSYATTTNKFPASFYYLACAKYTRDRNFAEWFAVAGYTRGIANITIESTTYDFGDIDVNMVQPRIATTSISTSINLIVNVRGNYYLWGNRTAHKLDQAGLTASHFLNIRQLCSSIKKQVYTSCRGLTFDPNDDILWTKFRNSITPLLDQMKANQGIKAYKIEKETTTVKAKLMAKIRITPIEAVEDFEIELNLEDSLAAE